MSELQFITNSQTEQDSILKQLSIASFQTAMSFLLEQLPNTISIYLLQFSEDPLLVGAFGLGILTTLAFGMGITNGLATGLETLVSQAYGANQYELCAKLYYRSLLLCTLFMVPISLFLLFSNQIIGLINHNTELVEQMGLFNTYMILAIFFNAIFVNTKVFLNGQNIYNYQLYTQLITCAIFLGQSYFFMIVLKLGIVGCAISYTFLDFFNNIILFLFMYFSKCSSTTLYPFKIHYLHKTVKFLLEAIPIGSILWLEWICFDCYVILASFLEPEIISAHVLMSNYAGLFYQFSYGISIVSTTYVGNEMGNQQVEMAKKYFRASFLIAGVFLLATQGLFAIFGKYFFQIFSDSEIMVDQLIHSLYFLILFILLDGMQAIISGLVRAVGREASASLTFILCYLVAGEVVGYILCYHMGLGLDGIWIGILIGSLSYDIIQFTNLFWKDWSLQAKEIKEKLASLHQQQITAIEDDD